MTNLSNLPKAESTENISTGNAEGDSSENVQYASDTATSQATGVSAGTKAKSYISIFADFVASLFYVAVVVLKPSLLKS